MGTFKRTVVILSAHYGDKLAKRGAPWDLPIKTFHSITRDMKDQSMFHCEGFLSWNSRHSLLPRFNWNKKHHTTCKPFKTLFPKEGKPMSNTSWEYLSAAQYIRIYMHLPSCLKQLGAWPAVPGKVLFQLELSLGKNSGLILHVLCILMNLTWFPF